MEYIELDEKMFNIELVNNTNMTIKQIEGFLNYLIDSDLNDFNCIKVNLKEDREHIETYIDDYINLTNSAIKNNRLKSEFINIKKFLIKNYKGE